MNKLMNKLLNDKLYNTISCLYLEDGLVPLKQSLQVFQ